MTGQSQKRSYRELQADGQRERCPHCGQAMPAVAQVLPDGMPDRTPEQREARRAQLAPTWQRVVNSMAKALPDLTMHQWISPLVLADSSDGWLFVAAPRSIGTWAQERYALVIAHHASAIAKRRLEVAIYTDPSLATSGPTRTVPDDTTDGKA